MLSTVIYMLGFLSVGIIFAAFSAAYVMPFSERSLSGLESGSSTVPVLFAASHGVRAHPARREATVKPLCSCRSAPVCSMRARHTT